MENSADGSLNMSSHCSGQPERVKNGKSFSSEGEKGAPEKQKEKNPKDSSIEFKMREKEALKKGEQDQTTVAKVSVMVYYTPDFKTFANDPVRHIKRQIAFANIVYSINDIPLNLSIFCIEELAIGKTNDWGIMLEYFSHAKKNLLNGACIAILMTGSGTKDREYAVVRHMMAHKTKVCQLLGCIQTIC